MEVMGWISASRHALSREVGMISREHVASDDWSMAALISSVEQGAKVARSGLPFLYKVLVGLQ